MNVLAIDTATPKPAVSVSVDGTLFEQPLPDDRRSSEELLPAVKRVLESAKLRLDDCDRLAVCSGPGSFTGIRIGMATAWGLGRASGIAVEAVSTLAAMAEAARGSSPHRVIAAVLDAGRGEIVLERFELTGPRASSLAPARRHPRPDLPGLAGTDAVVALPPDLAGEGGRELPMLVASALALAVGRAPCAASSSPSGASYSRPSAAEEKRGAS